MPETVYTLRDYSEQELLYWLSEPCNCTAGRPTADGILDAHTCFHHRAQVELDRRAATGDEA